MTQLPGFAAPSWVGGIVADPLEMAINVGGAWRGRPGEARASSSSVLAERASHEAAAARSSGSIRTPTGLQAGRAVMRRTKARAAHFVIGTLDEGREALGPDANIADL